LEEVMPLFAALLSIPTDDRCPPPDPDPQRRKERTLHALTDQLSGLAQEGPVLIILEDVHWADPTTLEFIGRTILRLPEMRWHKSVPRSVASSPIPCWRRCP